MVQVTNITADAKQRQTITLADGTKVTLRMEYKPQQIGWFFTQIIYGTRTISNLRITTSPNMLRQFKNVLPFGVACATNDGQEPTLQQDFFSGRASLFILDANDVAYYEKVLTGG